MDQIVDVSVPLLSEIVEVIQLHLMHAFTTHSGVSSIRKRWFSPLLNGVLSSKKSNYSPR